MEIIRQTLMLARLILVFGGCFKPVAIIKATGGSENTAVEAGTFKAHGIPKVL